MKVHAKCTAKKSRCKKNGRIEGRTTWTNSIHPSAEHCCGTTKNGYREGEDPCNGSLRPIARNRVRYSEGTRQGELINAKSVYLADRQVDGPRGRGNDPSAISKGGDRVLSIKK